MSFLGTARVLAGILWRRFLNRAQAILPGRRRTGERTGTARKRVGGILVSAGVAVVFGFNSMLQAFTILHAAAAVRGPFPDGTGRILVTRETLQTLERVQGLSPASRVENLRRVLTTDAMISPATRDIQDLWASRLDAHHAGHGAAGFRVVPWSMSRPYPVAAAWQDPAARRDMIRVGALLLLGMALVRFFLSLSAARQDLGRVGWTAEWLFTFPVPALHLFGAQIVGLALVDFFSWIAVFPMLWVYFYEAGLGWWSLGAALAGMVGFCLTAAGMQVWTETFLRKRLSLAGLKNVQALTTLLASAAFLGLYYFGRNGAAAGGLLDAARALPQAALWNPLSCAANGAAGAGGLCAAMAAGVLAVAASAGGCARLVRHGLLDTRGGAFQGRRGATAAGEPQGWMDRWLADGVAGKELRLLVRDRSRLVATLVLPLFCLVQMVSNSGVVEHLRGDFRACAACAFGMGSLMLISTCLTVLANDSRPLWFLSALPVRIPGMMRDKVRFWAVLAVGYTVLVLVFTGTRAAHLVPSDILTGMVACVGVAIHAFIAGGIGILRTDPLETEPQRRVPPSATYLYMLLVTMFGYALYAPSFWTQSVQLALSVLLALALWQKAGERIPFLLDPVSAAPPRVSAADGLIAVLTFFVLQGLLFLLGLRLQLDTGPAVVAAFGVAGVLVAGFHLWVTRGLPGYFEHPDGRKPMGGVPAAGLGVVGGAVAGLWAAVYLAVAQRVPYLRGLMEEVQGLRELRGAWLPVLAVVAAPLAEEFLFRGLLYRGLRRKYPASWAVLGSALLFALMHPPGGAVAVFGMGVVAAVVLEKTGRLWAAVLVHAVYNGLAVAVVLWGGH